MAPLLAALQQTVETVHDVRLPHQVMAYLVDAQVAVQLPGHSASLPEQFFVRTGNEAVEMALYIAPEVLAQLHGDDPHVHLHGGNLQAFCIALEGVSHFVYTSWRAAAGWPTRALELELQAEVDKFVASWFLLRRQRRWGPQTAAMLQRQLFSHYTLQAAVPDDDQARYHTASRSAEKFCRRLPTDDLSAQGEARLLAQVQKFCRQDLRHKLG